MALRNLISLNIKNIHFYNNNLFINNIISNRIFTNIKRLFNTSEINYIKEYQETRNGKILTIEGITKSSERAPYLLKPISDHSDCSLCALNLDVKHTDVLIISQFLRSDGCILPRRITGLCKMQQKKIEILVAMAQKSGLMMNLTPHYSRKDPKKRYQYKKFNMYFLEETIGQRKKIAKKWIPNLIQKPVL